jgi:RNA-directed DNA polymerase
VSARVASPAVEGRSPSDPVRALQHALYRAAKADPGRRFHSLRDKVYRRDVLWRAWVNVRRNNGAAGIDKTTLAMVEQYGVARLLGELADDLRDGGYRPLAARRVFIPKPGTTEQRPLSIPTVRDRVVQAAMPGDEDCARADLRGRYAALFVRVPAQTGRARRLAGAHR